MKMAGIVNRILHSLALNRPSYPVEIRVQLVKLLYSNSYRSMFALVYIATFTIAILWPIANHSQLIVWYGLIVLVALIRSVDTHLYHKNPELHHTDIWYRHFCLGVAANALLWGTITLFSFAEDQIVYDIFISMILVGIIAGSIVSLAADRRLVHINIYLMLLPLILKMIGQDGFIYISLVALLLFFLFFSSFAIRQAHTMVLNFLETQRLNLEIEEKLKKSEKRHRIIFEQSPTGTFFFDNDMVIIDCNAALCQIMQATREQIVGSNIRLLPDKRPLYSMTQALDHSKPALYEGPYHTRFSDLDLWVKIQTTPLIDDDGKKIGGLVTLVDKTNEHNAMKEVEFLSLHDPLTMLPNRKLLNIRMKQLIKEDRRSGSYSATLFLDLDHFKHINDIYGHTAGDKLLVTVSDELKKLLRTSDTLSRLGGDEFVILLPCVAYKQEAALYHAFEISERILALFEKPFILDDNTLHTSCSIGIVVVNGGEIDSDEILRRADIAMYQAKENGRNQSHFYDEELNEKTKENILLLDRLRGAIMRQEFSLFFQPILRAETGIVCGAEALLRWKDNNQEYISPEYFIPIAEESGLMNEIGRWVIEQSCRQMYLWQKDGHIELKYLTINISPKQMIDPEFESFLLQTIEENGLKNSSIKLEITEDPLINHFDKASLLIQRLKKVGIEFVIDDFGRGHSSLSYLKNLPFSMVKIDRVFVRDILNNKDSEAMIEAIIKLARQLDYDIVAECVEDQSQLDKLLELDKDICYQGFVTCKPCNPKDFEAFLNAHI